MSSESKLVDDAVIQIFTIGHGARKLEDFISLLKENSINLVIDIRTVPFSRHNPQFNQTSLPEALNKSGITRRHMPGLGGFRKARKDSENMGLKSPGFRGFADYMGTPQFEENFDALIQLARENTTVIMCAESVPWRCHRSLISDALTARGVRVKHILGKQSLREHTLTALARIDGKSVTYPLPKLL